MADDLISVLTEDHQELNGLLLELEVLSGGEHLQRVLTDQLIIESVRHAVAEECYLYPLYRTRVPGGQEIADRACGQHREMERILTQLEAEDVTDDNFALLLFRLIRAMRAHMEEEERFLVILAKHVGRDELLELGAKARESKALAPAVRPDTFDGPLVNMLVHGGSGLVERVRDYLSGHGRAYPPAR